MGTSAYLAATIVHLSRWAQRSGRSRKNMSSFSSPCKRLNMDAGLNLKNHEFEKRLGLPL
jgi:hypothetical protein